MCTLFIITLALWPGYISLVIILVLIVIFTGCPLFPPENCVHITASIKILHVANVFNTAIKILL